MENCDMSTEEEISLHISRKTLPVPHLRYVRLISLLISCLDVSLSSSFDMKDVQFACLWPHWWFDTCHPQDACSLEPTAYFTSTSVWCFIAVFIDHTGFQWTPLMLYGFNLVKLLSQSKQRKCLEKILHVESEINSAYLHKAQVEGSRRSGALCVRLVAAQLPEVSPEQRTWNTAARRGRSSTDDSASVIPLTAQDNLSLIRPNTRSYQLSSRGWWWL